MTKSFPGIVAVNNVDLEVQNGEIHGIIGKNGAGKSVLVSMIAGILKPTSGRLYIGETEIDGSRYNPGLAHNLGVSLIPQEPQFAPLLSVQDNIFMGIPIRRRMGFVNSHEMAGQVRALADQLALNVSPRQRMGELPLEDQQLLAFGKALFVFQSKVILLDEITASLTRQRKALLLNFLRETVQNIPGLSYTLISHHIQEVIEFCHRVTVMRDGQTAATVRIADTSANELAKLVVGSQTISIPAAPASRTKTPESNGHALLSVRGLQKRGRFADIDFELSKGEVIGLAGLDGCGKDEIMEVVVGLTLADSGSVLIQNQAVLISSPRHAARLGIAYLPKKREEQAVIHNRSVEENALLSIYPRLRTRAGLIDFGRSTALVQDHIRTLNIKTQSASHVIDSLSGGNRQKVVLSRVISKEPNIYVLNEPTRGVDLSVKPEILNTIRYRLPQMGGVIVTSESGEELIEVCDQILVLYRGRIHRILRRQTPEFNPQEVYRATQGL
ncbi:MAG: sugar ABC transporter ATP-binding protein [Anaerolineae bacterium]